jgi:hypothetical protein
MAIETVDDLRQHPLYDTAMEEIVEIMAPPMNRESLYWPQKAVRELMIGCWLRGAAWQNERLARTSAGEQS